MADRDRVLSAIGERRGIVVLGGLYVVAALGWTVTRIVESPTVSELIIFVLIAGPGVTITYIGYQLPQFDIRTAFYPTVAGWGLGGLVLMGAILGFYSLQPGESVDDLSTVFILTGLATVAGLTAGIHNAQAQTRARELEETIAELERSNERLEQYQQYTDDVLDAIDDLFYVIGADGTLRRWNESLADVTGYADDEIAGMRAEDFIVDDDRDAAVAAVRDGFETGSVSAELDLCTKDGDRVPIEFVASTLTDPRGETILAGVGRDVSERVERERELEQSERRYRTLAQHFPNGAVGVYDDDLTYTLAEGAVLGETLPPAAGLEGSRLSEVFPEDTVGDLEPLFRSAIDDGETGSATTEFGGRNWRVWATPLRDADGSIFAGLSLTQDITEQVERERRLEELIDQLEASNERLEQFAYAASHDLQEPLRMVSSYLRLVERRYADELDDEGREFIEFAVDGADRMRGMIEGLLEYSRIETRGDSFEPVDLDAIVADVRDDLQVRIEETDAELTTDPLPTVEGDAGQLRQVFQNLLDNAIEYSGDAPPRISVAARRDGSMWEISVSDEGIGIDPDDADRIFEVFQRLHSREDHEGTGIGLALVERIVERHGGDIRVESEPGEGTTFSLTLPAAASDV